MESKKRDRVFIDLKPDLRAMIDARRGTFSRAAFIRELVVRALMGERS